MATCPAGHESQSVDFCDICGMRIGASQAGGPSGGMPATSAEQQAQASAAPSGPAAELCPNCGAEQTGRFCEVCGMNFSTGALAAQPAPPARAVLPAPAAALAPAVSPAPAAAFPGQAAQLPVEAAQRPDPAPASPPASSPSLWTATIAADRAYFDSVKAEGGPDAHSIDFPAYCPERVFRLTGQQMRIGRRSVSRGIEPEIDLTGPPTDPGISHLHAILTADSGGGWSVVDPGSSNGTLLNGTAIATGVPARLHDGDRICIGGWTTLTIHCG